MGPPKITRIRASHKRTRPSSFSVDSLHDKTPDLNSLKANQQSEFFAIISIVSDFPKTFNNLSFAQLHHFIKALEILINPIKGSSIAARENLFGFPVNNMQKESILNLSSQVVDAYTIIVSNTKADTFFKMSFMASRSANLTHL